MSTRSTSSSMIPETSITSSQNQEYCSSPHTIESIILTSFCRPSDGQPNGNNTACTCEKVRLSDGQPNGINTACTCENVPSPQDAPSLAGERYAFYPLIKTASLRLPSTSNSTPNTSASLNLPATSTSMLSI
jgi:hypothetical protein